jgi:hypothetical protein
MQTKTKPEPKPRAAPEVGELSLAIVAKIPEHEEIQARYLKATKKRPNRVKLDYKKRRSLTFECVKGVHFVLQAAAELLERGVQISSYFNTDSGVARLSVEASHRLALDSIFIPRKK